MLEMNSFAMEQESSSPHLKWTKHWLNLIKYRMKEIYFFLRKTSQVKFCARNLRNQWFHLRKKNYQRNNSSCWQPNFLQFSIFAFSLQVNYVSLINVHFIVIFTCDKTASATHIFCFTVHFKKQEKKMVDISIPR